MSKDMRIPGMTGLVEFPDLDWEKPPKPVEVVLLSQEEILGKWPFAAERLGKSSFQADYLGKQSDIELAVKLANEAASAPYRIMEMDRFLIDLFTELNAAIPPKPPVSWHTMFLTGDKIALVVNDNGVSRTLYFENKDFYKFPKDIAQDVLEIVKALRKEGGTRETRS